MSTPSSWPPSPASPGRQPHVPQPYGAQAHGQQPYGQQPYGQQPYGVPVPYGQQAPVPYAPVPKPEKPLMPAVWWALVLNLVVTVVGGALLLLVGWAFISLLTGSTDLTQGSQTEGVGVLVLAVAGVMLGTVLVCWLLTVAALVLWRLLRGFRTIPAFVQALVAYVTMWVVSTVVSFVLQLAFGVFGASGGATAF